MLKLDEINKKVSITDLHSEHVSWSEEFQFQKDGLKVFQKGLEKAVMAHGDEKDVLKRIGYFQNQFIRHNEVLDSLLRLIPTHVDSISRYDQEHHFEVDDKAFIDHKGLREKLRIQQKPYTDLKPEYIEFLTKM